MSSFNFNEFVGYKKKNSFNKLQDQYNLVTKALKRPLSPRTKRRLTAEEHELARLLNEKFELLLKKEDHELRKKKILGKFPSPETQKREIEKFRKKQEDKQRKALKALRNANSLIAKSLKNFDRLLASNSVPKLSKKKGGALQKKSRKVRKSRKN